MADRDPNDRYSDGFEDLLDLWVQPDRSHSALPGNHIQLRVAACYALTPRQAAKLASYLLRAAGYHGTATLADRAFCEEEERLARRASRSETTKEDA